MKPEIKERWVKALRSGEYIKIRGILGSYNCFCVLGVLCDLHAKETKTEWDNSGSYLGCLFSLPKKVKEWSGLENCMIRGVPIIRYNDDIGLSFNELADLIEKHL